MAAKNKLEYILDLSSEEFKKKLKNAGIDVNKLDDNLAQTGKTGKKSFKDLVSGVGSFAVGLNQGVELLKKVYDGVQAVNKANRDFEKNTTLIEKRLDTTRETAVKLNSQFKALSETFETDFNQQIMAANALQEEFGSSAEQAFNLLETAARKIPDQFGEIIEVTKEYSSQLSQLGIDADQFLSITTQALQQGVFSDKGVDAIKEFNLSFREGTTATREAFTALALDYNKLQEQVQSGAITVFDVLAKTSDRMKELGIEAPETGQALADIFRGAGEDAGKFILNIGTLETSLDKVETQISEAQEAQLKFNKSIQVFQDNLIRFTSPALKIFNETIGEFIGLIGDNLNSTMKAVEAENFLEAIEDSNMSVEEFVKTLSETELKEGLKSLNFGLVAFRNNSKILPQVQQALSAVNQELTKDKADSAKAYFSNIFSGVKSFLGLGQEEVKNPLTLTDEEKENTILKLREVGVAYLETIDLTNEKNNNVFDGFKARLEAEANLLIGTQKEFAQATQASLGVLFNSLIVEQDNLFKAIGEGTRSILISVLDMWAKTEIAKLTFSSWSTFGTSLAGILPILGALEAAKAGLSAIKFEDGGGMTTGASHAEGGTKFLTKSEPGVIKEYEGNEYIMSGKTVARIGKHNLDAMNFYGKTPLLFENGGSMTRTVQPPVNVNPNINLGSNNITVMIDGEEIPARVNIVNNNNRGAGQILTENT